MEIAKIFSYLVYPGKNEKTPEEVKNAEITLSGKLFEMLRDLFEKSSYECNIPIRFVVEDDDPPKTNKGRTQLIGFLKEPCIDKGEEIAIRLRDVTTKVPGIGLLFLIIGKNNNSTKLVISRFPAEQGILAGTNEGKLEIEFLEKIFMKNSLSYKAVLYEFSPESESNFWQGTATDKQRNYGSEIANYWIKDFLNSDYRTTSVAGTRRFVNALRIAINEAKGLAVKQELMGLSTLAKGFHKRSCSINEILTTFKISDESKSYLTSQFSKNSNLLDDIFEIDQAEFINHAPHRSIELDTGAIVMAPTEKYDELIKVEKVGDQGIRCKVSTEGEIIDERLRGK